MRVKLLKGVKWVCDEAVQKSPIIFTIGAVAGLWVTVYFSSVATEQAKEAIELERERRERVAKANTHGKLKPDPLTGLEEAKIALPYYTPVALSGAVTTGFIVGLHFTHEKRYEALTEAYTAILSTFRGYRSKTAEYCGPRKANRILDEVYADEISKNPQEENLVIQTGMGETLCYMRQIRRYFRSDIDFIRHCINICEQELFSNEFLSLNDFLLEMRLPLHRLGDETGWDADRGGIEIEYSSTLSNRGEPVLVVDCRTIPRYYKDYA